MAVRAWALAAVVVLSLLFARMVVATFGPTAMVVPTVGVHSDKAAGLSPSDALAQRTELQREDKVASGAESARISSQDRRIDFGGGVEKGRALVAGWLRDTAEAGSVEGATPSAERTAPAGSTKSREPQLLQPPDYRQGTSSLPYREADVLVQPQGRDFRRAHEDRIRYAGGWLIFGTALALGLFLLGRGRIKTPPDPNGEKIERFDTLERSTHWMTASAFLIMALTGLVILYGKPLLMPWLGAHAFSNLASLSAWVHMAASVPFVLGVLTMLVLWTGGNLFTRLDWEWLKRGGGFMHDEGVHPAADRFNAGQKLTFWAVVLGGLAMLATGVMLMLPFYVMGYTGMQWSQLLHAAIGLAMIALIIGHIYIGSVGMTGAFSAMWSGFVDRNWARTHHRLWLERLRGREQPGE